MAGSKVIYRIPDRVPAFRALGLFCLGHSIAWGTLALSWYTGKASLDPNHIWNMSLKDVWRNMVKKETTEDTSNSTETKSSFMQSITPKLPFVERLHQSNQEGLTRFLANYHKYTDPVNNFIESNRLTIMTVFGIFIASITLSAGYFLPRRAVRQISLLPFRPTVSSSSGGVTRQAQEQLVEIRTYGTFGLRSSGARLVVPLDSIRTKADPKRTNYLTFRVQKYFIPFFVQFDKAEFPEPEEFEYTFILGTKC